MPKDNINKWSEAEENQAARAIVGGAMDMSGGHPEPGYESLGRQIASMVMNALHTGDMSDMKRLVKACEYSHKCNDDDVWRDCALARRFVFEAQGTGENWRVRTWHKEQVRTPTRKELAIRLGYKWPEMDAELKGLKRANALKRAQEADRIQKLQRAMGKKMERVAKDAGIKLRDDTNAPR